MHGLGKRSLIRMVIHEFLKAFGPHIPLEHPMIRFGEIDEHQAVQRVAEMGIQIK